MSVSENMIAECDGKPCLHQNQFIKWLDSLTKWDGTYPDPIDNSPCDTCKKGYTHDL